MFSIYPLRKEIERRISMEYKRKVVLYIAMSLDGYIAAKDDSLEWLFQVEGKGDNGYSDFIETIDTIAMGKRTYDWVIKHTEGEFPYRNKECYVFTKSSLPTTEQVQFINENVRNFINKLKNQAGKNIWLVGGGELASSFFQESLIDEFIITIAPTILGSGIPLFKEGSYQFNLHLKGIKRFNQFTELRYQVIK